MKNVQEQKSECLTSSKINFRDYDGTNDNGDWALILLVLLFGDAEKKDEQWSKFEKELIYKNRFSSENSIVKELHKKKELASRTILKGSSFYRARVFGTISADRILKYYLKEQGVSEEEIDDICNNKPKYYKELMLSLMNIAYDPNNDSSFQSILSIQKKWNRNVKFKGYNAKDSSAPDADLVTNGRANPDHIRYLYLCEDKLTSVYEVRPYIGQAVSVAKFRLLRDINVYDLTLEIPETTQDGKFQFESLFNSIGRMFSKPYTGEVSKYIPTQYLAEEIKKMGFDGLRFNSSLHEGGVNLVLFDPEVCKAVSSDLVNVKSITIETETPWIYQIGKAGL